MVSSSSQKEILVTGGAGFIGSHVCVELIKSGYRPIVVDNLCNSSEESLKRVAQIVGVEPIFYKADINDHAAMRGIFAKHRISSVMHFAGLKAVGESNTIPMKYYRTNVAGSLSLTEVMEEFDVWNFIFSSSATVYGDPVSVPIDESFNTSATNPYGRSKLMVEEILRDISKSDARWNIALLRYFNPVGAHESGMIGEDPAGIPNNLLPYIAQVAIGKLKELSVFGKDYNTVDGTGVRDYIHVVDLARGHVAALKKLEAKSIGCQAFNLGTGTGYSVLEMIAAFEQASGRKVPYKISARRPGDIASCYANAEYAKQELGWTAEYDLERMMKDAWRWQEKNPNGYRDL